MSDATTTAQAAPKAQKTAPVKLLYDYWGDDGERLSAGSVVELPLDRVKALLGEKKAERADPLPGDK